MHRVGNVNLYNTEHIIPFRARIYISVYITVLLSSISEDQANANGRSFDDSTNASICSELSSFYLFIFFVLLDTEFLCSCTIKISGIYYIVPNTLYLYLPRHVRLNYVPAVSKIDIKHFKQN